MLVVKSTVAGPSGQQAAGGESNVLVEEVKVMRRVVVVVFALLMAAGAASAASGRPPAEPSHDRARASAPVAVQGIGLPFAGIRDEAAMVLVGTVLIGLAAAVRRAA